MSWSSGRAHRYELREAVCPGCAGRLRRHAIAVQCPGGSLSPSEHLWSVFSPSLLHFLSQATITPCPASFPLWPHSQLSGTCSQSSFIHSGCEFPPLVAAFPFAQWSQDCLQTLLSLVSYLFPKPLTHSTHLFSSLHLCLTAPNLLLCCSPTWPIPAYLSDLRR